MRIAVDAMSGDYAPEAFVEGALPAKPQCPAELVLFGEESRLRAIRLEAASPVHEAYAPQTIGAGEAMRLNPQSRLASIRKLPKGWALLVSGCSISGRSRAKARRPYSALSPCLNDPAFALLEMSNHMVCLQMKSMLLSRTGLWGTWC